MSSRDPPWREVLQDEPAEPAGKRQRLVPAEPAHPPPGRCPPTPKHAAPPRCPPPRLPPSAKSMPIGSAALGTVPKRLAIKKRPPLTPSSSSASAVNSDAAGANSDAGASTPAAAAANPGDEDVPKSPPTLPQTPKGSDVVQPRWPLFHQRLFGALQRSSADPVQAAWASFFRAKEGHSLWKSAPTRQDTDRDMVACPKCGHPFSTAPDWD